MATRIAFVNGTPCDVWDVLSDGYSYREWVVGTSEIRSVDEDWPSVGSSLHYSIGRGRLRFEDRTTVRLCEPERRLELEAHAAPFGTARIGIEMLPWAEGSLVTVVEHPLRAPGVHLYNPVTEAALRLRNLRLIKNLARLVERRGGR
jgi:hypothetical protein